MRRNLVLAVILFAATSICASAQGLTFSVKSPGVNDVAPPTQSNEVDMDADGFNRGGDESAVATLASFNFHVRPLYQGLDPDWGILAGA